MGDAELKNYRGTSPIISSENSILLVWFLKGDKFLHGDTEKKYSRIFLGVGACLYVCVLVINELIWHFTPYRGMDALIYLFKPPFFLFWTCFMIVFVTRRILFGANIRRPAPLRGLPDNTEPRVDYQNVIPPVGEKKWLINRIAAYVDIFFNFQMLMILGWAITTPFSMPYFLLQK